MGLPPTFKQRSLVLSSTFPKKENSPTSCSKTRRELSQKLFVVREESSITLGKSLLSLENSEETSLLAREDRATPSLSKHGRELTTKKKGWSSSKLQSLTRDVWSSLRSAFKQEMRSPLPHPLKQEKNSLQVTLSNRRQLLSRRELLYLSVEEGTPWQERAEPP